jgi:hypothetical protein
MRVLPAEHESIRFSEHLFQTPVGSVRYKFEQSEQETDYMANTWLKNAHVRTNPLSSQQSRRSRIRTFLQS